MRIQGENFLLCDSKDEDTLHTSKMWLMALKLHLLSLNWREKNEEKEAYWP